MIHLIFFIISFLASLAGSVCGIGGGVIMKPLLDAFGILRVSAISFLSGCTVLAMSAVSIGSTLRQPEKQIDMKEILPLALGAAAGGVIGKIVFQEIRDRTGSEDMLGLIQAAVLLAITALTFVYTIRKQKIRTLKIENGFAGLGVGLLLGCSSSFLGIGGGPINLMVLNFCFSMSTKKAAVNSLFIILISQIFSIGQTVLTGTVPEVDLRLLLLMAVGGILGGKLGNRVRKGVDERYVDLLFEGMMLAIMAINVHNIFSFM